MSGNDRLGARPLSRTWTVGMVLGLGLAAGVVPAAAGPLPSIGVAGAIVALMVLVWVCLDLQRVLLLYAFVLPLDVYLSTTLRLTSTQLLQVVAATAWFVHVMVRGRSPETRHDHHGILGLGAVLIVYLCLSLAWSVNLDASARMLLRLLGAITMSAMVFLRVQNERQLQRVVGAACLGALTCALYGLVQYARGDFDALYPLFSPFYTDLWLQRGVGFSIVATFSNPNILAAYGTMILPLAWGRTSLSKGRARMIWALTSVLVGTVIVLTFSKTSWVVMAALLTAWLAVRLAQPTRILSVCAVAIGGGVLLLMIDPTLELLARSFPNTREGSVNIRLELWQAGLTAFLDRPVLGFGLDGYASATAEARPKAAELLRAHNLYLQTLVDLGVLGSLLMWATVSAIFVRGLTAMQLASTRSQRLTHFSLLLSTVSFLLFALVDALYSNQYVNTHWLVFGLLAASSTMLARNRSAAARA